MQLGVAIKLKASMVKFKRNNFKYFVMMVCICLTFIFGAFLWRITSKCDR